MKQKGRHSKHKSKIGRALKEKWESKEMHRENIRSTDRQLISEDGMLLWLSGEDLKGETEIEMVTAQFQALQTEYHAVKKITNRNTQHMQTPLVM
jgi:hypothetical protein